MEWKTDKDEQIHTRGVEKGYKNKPGSRREETDVK